MIDFSTLNPPQREAVETVDGPLLVLAGAGSGKTRVLTYRIANLIENHGVYPSRILALTFTNKAAAEMRERTEKLTGISAKDMWVTTFHSFCAKILRFDIEALGTHTSRFTIYDDGDQNTVITDIIKKMGLDEKRVPKGYVRSLISEAKNSSDRPRRAGCRTNARTHPPAIRLARGRDFRRALKSLNPSAKSDESVSTRRARGILRTFSGSNQK